MAVTTTTRPSNHGRCMNINRATVIKTVVVLSALSFTLRFLHQYSTVGTDFYPRYHQIAQKRPFVIFNTHSSNQTRLNISNETDEDIGKEALDLFLSFTESTGLSLYLIDPDIVSINIFNGTITNNTMEGRNMITLGMNGTVDTKVTVFDHLKDKGFRVYCSEINTIVQSLISNQTLPGHFLIYHEQTDFLIHTVVFYKRYRNFLWCDRIQKEKLMQDIKQQNSSGLNSNLTVLWDKLHYGKVPFSFKSINTVIGISENTTLLIPETAEKFLKDYNEPQFLECNYTRAEQYNKEYKQSKSPTKWALKALNMLEKTGEALDKYGIPFTIAEGTLLGWYRQCGIISYTSDIDILVFRDDYSENILKSLKKVGFHHTLTFGKLNDSYEYSFSWSGVKMDLFFVYKDKDTFWLGGTNGKNKLKFSIPKFKNCWSELLGVRVRVPCDAAGYVKKSYGKNWYKPISRWSWASDASNYKVVGKWSRR